MDKNICSRYFSFFSSFQITYFILPPAPSSILAGDPIENIQQCIFIQNVGCLRHISGPSMVPTFNTHFEKYKEQELNRTQ